MLEKFITQLKESLPEALRKKLGYQTSNEADDLEDDELSEDKTEVSVRYEGFSEDEIDELKQEDSDSESEEDSEVEPISDEEKKKKQKSMLIKVLAVLFIGYVAVDELVLKKSDTSNASQDSSIVESSQDMPSSESYNQDQMNNDLNNSVEESTFSQTESANSEFDTNFTEPPIEDINIQTSLSENNNSFAEETQNDDPFANSIENAQIDNSMDTSSNDSNISNEFASSNESFSNSESSSDPFSNSDLTNSTEVETSYPSLGGSANNTFNYGDELINSTESQESLDSKIVDNIVSTPAPNYENFGRGLVYNCADKHWACIDKPSYVSCHKNYLWNKQQGKKVECVTKNVYTTDEDCNKVQLHYVSNNENTSFCN